MFVRHFARAACLSLLLVTPFSHAEDIIAWDGFESQGCPDGRLASSDILYYSTSGWPIARDVDLTEWENIWGAAAPAGTLMSWPGQTSVTIVIQQFQRDRYIAAHFRVPEGTTYTGFLNHGTYFAGAQLTGAISRWCGDFTHVEPHCTREAGAGEALIRWRTEDSTGQCTLDPGDYYVNIKLTDPSQQVAGCGSESCEENIQSLWSAY